MRSCFLATVTFGSTELIKILKERKGRRAEGKKEASEYSHTKEETTHSEGGPHTPHSGAGTGVEPRTILEGRRVKRR